MKKSGWFLIAFSVLIGFFLASQAQISNGQKLYVSAKVLDDYKTTIDSERQSTEQIRQRIQEAEERLKEYETYAQQAGDDSLLQEAQEKLDYYKLVSHYTDVRGEGVTVYIDDGTRDLMEGESVNNLLVHDADLLVIINDLLESGAEAISVNGHRIASGSSVSCSGYTVRINGQFEARPFRIKAIGDSNRMMANLMGAGGYGTLLKEGYGLVFKVTVEDDLFIPAYPEEKVYRYMTMTKEGETS